MSAAGGAQALVKEDAMAATTLDAKVDDFLAQKRIAVAGVSRKDTDHPAANLIYRRLKASGHDVFPVNPNMQTFDGDRCYPDLSSIPGGVEGVVIVTRPDVTERIVHQCDDAGVRRVWMHQSLAKGTSVSPAAVEYCEQHGIGVIAGACPMMYGDHVDFGHTCMRWVMKLTGGLPQ
jgi:predicted CoA-binding protein